MNTGVLMHIVRTISGDQIRGKRVLEVGSLNHNGGIREVFSNFEPAEYIGIDMLPGPGVDKICKVEDLVNEFGKESFDVVVSTELLEHVHDWTAAVCNMKEVLKVGGILVITTRSPGMPYHGYPYDFWRFTRGDFILIFAEYENRILADDPGAPTTPGIFFTGTKAMKEQMLIKGMSIQSVVLNHLVSVDDIDTNSVRWKLGIQRAKVEDIAKSLYTVAHKVYHFPSFLKDT